MLHWLQTPPGDQLSFIFSPPLLFIWHSKSQFLEFTSQ